MAPWGRGGSRISEGVGPAIPGSFQAFYQCFLKGPATDHSMMRQTLDLGTGITRFYKREKLLEALTGHSYEHL